MKEEEESLCMACIWRYRQGLYLEQVLVILDSYVLSYDDVYTIIIYTSHYYDNTTDGDCCNHCDDK